jgi:glycosyltransferase involved in cell wall biosynthesis
MSALEKVSVVLPTLNANGALLQAHVSGLNSWIADIHAVFVVDSGSTDGTVDYIREYLKHPRVHFFERPKGLYQAWNFAVQQVKTEYTYIATVGDVIDPDGVGCLIELLERHRGDIAISPPSYLAEDGSERSNFRWPVDTVVELLGDASPSVLDPELVCALHSTEFPATLAGSAASNLYRTDYLQRNPFPLEFGNQGDSAWAVRASAEARWCLYPKRLAGLVFHARQSPSVGSKKAGSPRRALLENLNASIQADAGWRQLVDESPLSALQAALSDQAAAKERWSELRTQSCPWFLSARGWVAQRARKRSAAICAERKREALDWFKARFGPAN